MLLRAHRSLVLSALALLAACGSDGPVGPAGGPFSLGQSLAVESGRDVRVATEGASGNFIAVVVNLGLDSGGQTSYSLRASGIEAVDRGLFGARIPSPDADRRPSPTAPTRDLAF